MYDSNKKIIILLKGSNGFVSRFNYPIVPSSKIHDF